MGDVKNFRFKTTNGDINIPVKDTTARERIGDLEQLQTPHKDNIVNAINDLEGGGSGTSNYNDLNNKPSINGVTLIGNKTTEDLGIEGVTDYDELDNKPTINGVELEGNLSTEDLDIDYDDILNRPVESGDLDIDAVVDPLPTVVSKSNVVFDERGTEYEDGIYIKEIDGTAMYKPVWRKDIIWTGTIPANQYVTIGTISNVETPISICGTIRDGSSINFHQLGASNWSGVNFQNTGGVNVSAYTNYGAGSIVRAMAEYTKTTDEWQEYEEATQ